GRFVASPGSGRGVTVVRSHPDLSDPSTRLLMPTTEQGPFPPFDRFADTVANARVQRGLHEHLAEEVVAYVLDGQVHHEDGAGEHTVLRPGSVLLVTAHEQIRHELTMQPSQEGRAARWLSIVLRLPCHTQAPVTSVQITDAGDAIPLTTTVVERPIVGSRAGRAVGIVRDSHRSLATRNAGRSPIRLLRPRIRDARLVPRATCRSVQSVV